MGGQEIHFPRLVSVRVAHHECISAKLYTGGVQGPFLAPTGVQGVEPWRLLTFSNFKP